MEYEEVCREHGTFPLSFWRAIRANDIKLGNPVFKELLRKYNSYPSLLPVQSTHPKIFFTREESEASVKDGLETLIGRVYSRLINSVDVVFIASQSAIDYHSNYYAQEARNNSRLRIELHVTPGMWSYCDNLEAQRVQYKPNTTLNQHVFWPREELLEPVYEPKYPLKHYYSKTLLEGIRLSDTMPRSNCHIYQDVTHKQIRYCAGPQCYYTWIDIDICRCIFCIPLQTAKLPDIGRLEESQHVAVRCVLELFLASCA